MIVNNVLYIDNIRKMNDFDSGNKPEWAHNLTNKWFPGLLRLKLRSLNENGRRRFWVNSCFHVASFKCTRPSPFRQSSRLSHATPSARALSLPPSSFIQQILSMVFWKKWEFIGFGWNLRSGKKFRHLQSKEENGVILRFCPSISHRPFFLFAHNLFSLSLPTITHHYS